MRGQPEPSRGSMQGTYVLTPAGECIGRINSRNADAVAAMLERALADFDQRPSDHRSLRPDAIFRPHHRWEHSYPEGGLVLERFARDIGDEPTAEPIRPVNRDTVWFTRGEARGWLPAKLTTDATREVARPLAARLARLALVDNVRGQTLPFAAAEIERADLRATVVGTAGDRVELEISGSTRAVAKGPWQLGDNYWKPRRDWPRWIECTITGRATWNTAEQRFIAFELVALGKRQGRTTFNGRHREDAERSYRIGFLLRLAPPDWRVAPTFVNVYDAAWVEHPKR